MVDRPQVACISSLSRAGSPSCLQKPDDVLRKDRFIADLGGAWRSSHAHQLLLQLLHLAPPITGPCVVKIVNFDSIVNVAAPFALPIDHVSQHLKPYCISRSQSIFR